MPSSPQVHLRPRKKRRSLQQTSYKRCITGLAYWGTRHLSTMRFGARSGAKVLEPRSLEFRRRTARTFGRCSQERLTSWRVSEAVTFMLCILSVASPHCEKAIGCFTRPWPSAWHMGRIRRGLEEQRLAKRSPPTTANRSHGRLASGSRRRTRAGAPPGGDLGSSGFQRSSTCTGRKGICRGPACDRAAGRDAPQARESQAQGAIKQRRAAAL